jgi:putative oxygen-independent coproporphyrinogen III oxidase
MRGLYVHIPFCVHKCSYCDFYSLPDRLDSLNAYLEALLVEAAQYRKQRFETLFIGGGTPSLLGPAGLRKLMTGLSGIFSFSKLFEATIEANPESVTRDFLQAALESRINRISIGVQSLSDIELQSVGRVHSAAQAIHAIEMAQKAGFENVSGDVILGLPGQNWQSLMTTLETLTGMNLTHISMYCLAVEPHTPLAANLPADLPSDDSQADLYAQAVTLMEKRGFIHYEISNFALPGYECRHNLNYWQAGEYIGLGPAAASYHKGYRFKNKPDLAAYLTGPTGQKYELEKLSRAEKAAEEAILRLRLLQEGLDLSSLIQKYGDTNVISLAARLNQLSMKGHLRRDGCLYRLKPQDALVSNSILSELMGD